MPHPDFRGLHSWAARCYGRDDVHLAVPEPGGRFQKLSGTGKHLCRAGRTAKTDAYPDSAGTSAARDGIDKRVAESHAPTPPRSDGEGLEKFVEEAASASTPSGSDGAGFEECVKEAASRSPACDGQGLGERIKECCSTTPPRSDGAGLGEFVEERTKTTHSPTAPRSDGADLAGGSDHGSLRQARSSSPERRTSGRPPRHSGLASRPAEAARSRTEEAAAACRAACRHAPCPGGEPAQ